MDRRRDRLSRREFVVGGGGLGLLAGTAQALGVTFPNEIMLQVTEVIQ